MITVQDQDPADFDPRLGKQFGVYVLVARVADGAMGRVYEGRHPQGKERVAIKVLHEQVARDRVAVERFKREYETARELDNPYIVKVLDFGQSPDQSWFMTMEYLEGEELSKAIARKKPLPFPRIVRTLSQIALALEHAHSYGYIHRDLKPENIFLCETADGTQVRLLDFGSVKLQVETGIKLTALGTTLGSPYYMSPEQATGSSSVDQRSDVFALGAILYELLTAKTAFEASTVALIVMKILNQQPPPPSTINPAATAQIDAVVEHALRKDQAVRYPTARALADGLLAALGLDGPAERWAHTEESAIAAALASAKPRSQPLQAQQLQPRTPPPAAVTSSQRPAAPPPAGPLSQPPKRSIPPTPRAAPAKSLETSEVPLTVPMNGLSNKWWLAAAVAVLLAVVAFIVGR